MPFIQTRQRECELRESRNSNNNDSVSVLVDWMWMVDMKMMMVVVVGCLWCDAIVRCCWCEFFFVLFFLFFASFIFVVSRVLLFFLFFFFFLRVLLCLRSRFTVCCWRRHRQQRFCYYCYCRCCFSISEYIGNVAFCKTTMDSFCRRDLFLRSLRTRKRGSFVCVWTRAWQERASRKLLFFPHLPAPQCVRSISIKWLTEMDTKCIQKWMVKENFAWFLQMVQWKRFSISF